MAKWATVRAQVKSTEDFKLLAKLLEGLGFGPSPIEEYQRFRVQMFTPTASMLELIHRDTPRGNPDLELVVSDPDSVVGIAQGMGLTITDDSVERDSSVRSFVLNFPGGTHVYIMGVRKTVAEVLRNAGIQGDLSAKGKRFAIVVSRFNSFITERLLEGAIDGLARCGGAGDVEIVRVPGSFEIPSAARTLAETGKYDAIICLGCLLRGDTPHYDVIVNEVTRGIGQSAQETGVPHAFGVLTCDTLEQAIDRAGLKMGNKGFEAALAAVEMANLKKAVVGRRSSVVRSPKTSSGGPSFVVRKSKRKHKTRKPKH